LAARTGGVASYRTITVQNGGADTVVRAMNVEYRKWRLGRGVL